MSLLVNTFTKLSRYVSENDLTAFHDKGYEDYGSSLVNIAIPELTIQAPSQVSPDFLVASESEIFGMEIKALKNSDRKYIDFNSTPPCSHVDIYPGGRKQLVKCYYLFLNLIDKSIVMLHGSYFNTDRNFYEKYVGERDRVVGLGSHQDIIDRQRPMFLVPNVLKHKFLQGTSTLIVPEEHQIDSLHKTCVIHKQNNTYIGYSLESKPIIHENIKQYDMNKLSKKRNKFIL